MKKADEEMVRELIREELQEGIQYGVDTVFRDMWQIKKADDTPDWFWASMARDGDTLWWRQDRRPYWETGLRIFTHDEPGGRDYIKHTLPDGLQPGMLCKVTSYGTNKQPSLYYKITEVVECHLPIRADWRECKVRVQMVCDAPSVCPTNVKDCYIPYLPNTDVQILCDFEERIRKWKAIFTDEETRLATEYARHFPMRGESPLITLDLLKERGVDCGEPLRLFQEIFPTGCTFEALWSVIELRRRTWASPSLEKLRAWARWIEKNLWDLRNKSTGEKTFYD